MSTSSSVAARGVARAALVTCRAVPDLDPDDQLLREALGSRGVAASAAVWDDPDIDWASYDLAVLRSTWDYVPRREAFLAWTRTVPALANTAAVVAWNTDKRYLADLADAGVPVVPTTWITPGGPPWSPPPVGRYVVKPAVGAGSVDVGRYDLTSPEERGLAVRHVSRLLAAGRVAMLQPYLPAVDTVGETALVYLGGRFSHAVRKEALLDGPDQGTSGLYRPEKISPRTPAPEELAVGARALAAVPVATELLYARVDLIPGPDGTPRLVELELTEPSLFLGYAPGAADRLAEAVGVRLAGRRR